MNLTYLICSIIFPLICIIFGTKARKNPPKTISKSTGYATALSMQSKEAWDFAHKFIGNLWQKGGIILLVISAIIGYSTQFVDKGKAETIVMSLIIVQIALMGASVYPTEKKLAKLFPIDTKKIDEERKKPIKMIIDVDTGVDDALALLFALKQPRIDIMGIVASRGNVTASVSAENSLKVIELSGCQKDIPVVIGADCALDGSARDLPTNIHGENGLGNAVLPAPTRKVSDIPFEDFIYKTVTENEGDIVYVATGPMTSLAKAIQKYPDIPSKIKRFVAMGGAVKTTGNVLPLSEANIFGDPAAANICLGSEMKSILVPLDVTHKVIMKKEDLIKLQRSNRNPNANAVIQFVIDSFEPYFDFYEETVGMKGKCPLHDPTAVLIAASPFCATKEFVTCRVEENGELTKGMIVTDNRFKKDKRFYNVEFACDIDAKATLNMILDSLKA